MHVLGMAADRNLGRLVRTMAVGVLLTSGFTVRARAADEEERDDNQFREDVVLCEDAVAHAKSCCGFRVQGDACRYYHYSYVDDCGCDVPGTDGSGSEDVWPVVTPSEARGVLAASCEELQERLPSGRTRCAVVEGMMARANERSSYVQQACK